MLAARATARRAARLARNFASAADAAGIKVAAVDNGQPTSSVTFLVNAGSRYESKPGVANVLKNFAFKSTAARSALGTVRETELFGGVLSSSLSREYLSLTAEFLRGDEEFFVDVLSSFINSSKFTQWELDESVLPTVAGETQAAASDSATVALELAHAFAFHNGLGSSIFAPSHPSISAQDVKDFASQVLSKSNIAVLGTGISQEALAKLVEKRLGSVSAGSVAARSTSGYFGGETRQSLHGAPQTVFVGFGATGTPAPELALLNAHLSTSPSVKWSASLSPLASVIPAGASVQPVLLSYSDAALFGLLVQGESAATVKEAAVSSVKVLQETTSGASLTPEQLKAAIAKAKFSAAAAVESREGLVSTLGPNVLSGSPATLSSIYSTLDAVSASSFSKVTSSLLKTKPTFVAVGDTNALPYVNELGL